MRVDRIPAGRRLVVLPLARVVPVQRLTVSADRHALVHAVDLRGRRAEAVHRRVRLDDVAHEAHALHLAGDRLDATLELRGACGVLPCDGSDARSSHRSMEGLQLGTTSPSRISWKSAPTRGHARADAMPASGPMR